MEYKAVAKNIKMSPRKVRLVADSVRNTSAESAMRKLELVHKRAALPIKKAMKSAIANAEAKNVKKETLVIKTLKVDEGVTYKRYRFASRGRVAPILHRTSHITVVLEEKASQGEVKKEEIAVATTTEAVKEKKGGASKE